MKKIFTFLAVLVAIGSFAQGKVAERIAELKSGKAIFKHYSILDATDQANQGETSKVVSKATFAKIRTADVNN
ncbi:MAG: hypothetical protein EOP06_23200, partial [Proteobacteria bacterium]